MSGTKKTKDNLAASQTAELSNLLLKNITVSFKINYYFCFQCEKLFVLDVKWLSTITSIFAVQPEIMHLLKNDAAIVL